MQKIWLFVIILIDASGFTKVEVDFFLFSTVFGIYIHIYIYIYIDR